MLSDYPDLVAEWDYEKNIGLDILQYTRGSDKQVWWKCLRHGHSWKTKITKRTAGNNCGICANKVVLRGFNDVATTVPIILDFWDFEKNTEVSLYEVTKFSRKEAFFKCDCGYEWKKKVCYFVENKEKCAKCSGKIVDERNSLAINCPELVEEWDFEKNKDLNVNDFTLGMNKNVWWKCVEGHSWRAKVAGRVANKHSCPYCSNQKLLQGYNDLATTHPDVLKDWDYSKNKNVSPDEVSYGSDKKVWWKCSAKGHSFQSYIKSRVYNNSGCPLCSHRIIVKGTNDILTEFPEVLDMIDLSLTNIKELYDCSVGSKKKVWWKCLLGDRSWEASIKSRLLLGSGCPTCSGRVSKSEQNFAEYIEKTLPEGIVLLRNERSLIHPYELDVYIPDLSLAFEFNGDYWHSDEVIRERSGMSADEYHDRKVKLCADKGVVLTYVWESEWLDHREGAEAKLIKIIEEACSNKEEIMSEEGLIDV